MTRLSDIDKINCIKMYIEDKKSCSQIAEIYKVTGSAIQGILKRRGIPRRSYSESSARKKYHANENIFSVIDTEEKAYWLGFIMADGNVSRQKTLRIELSTIDINHLEKFKKFMEHDGVLRNDRTCTVISIRSIVLSKDLAKWGVIPNKSFLTKTPKINDTLKKHFYRGILDGDGWISNRYQNENKKYEIGFCSGNRSFLEEIKKWINTKIRRDIGYIISREKKNQRCSQLTFGGNTAFLQICNLLYNNPSVYLERKKIKIDLAIKDIERQRTSA